MGKIAILACRSYGFFVDGNSVSNQLEI